MAPALRARVGGPSAHGPRRRRPRVDGCAQFTRKTTSRIRASIRASSVSSSRTGASGGSTSDSAVGTRAGDARVARQSQSPGHRGLLRPERRRLRRGARRANPRGPRGTRGGTTGPSLFDASGFVQAAFANVMPRPVFIPRRVHEQHHCRARGRPERGHSRPRLLRRPAPDAFKGCVDVRHVGIITAVR